MGQKYYLTPVFSSCFLLYVLLMCFNPSVALVGPEPHFNCRCKGDELPLKEVNKREAPFNKQLPTRTKEKEQNFLLPNGQTSFAFGKVKIEGWAVFYKGNQSVAIVKPTCVVPGHVLVVPLKPNKRMVNLPEDELVDLFITSQKVQRGMEEFFGVTSTTVIVQDGPDAGQSIEHVHVHIMPRRPKDFKENDEIYGHLDKDDQGTKIKWRPESEMKEEARQLRKFFKAFF